MSELTDVLTSRVRLMRNTDLVLDETTISDAMSASRQPAKASYLEVKLSGASVGGTITVAGSTNESFVFTANGTLLGSKAFSSINSIGVNGISAGTLQVRAVTLSGQPVLQEAQVFASLACRIFIAKGRTITIIPGQKQQNRQKIMFAPSADVRDNDVIYPVSLVPGITSAVITFVDTIFDFAGMTHHLECDFE